MSLFMFCSILFLFFGGIATLSGFVGALEKSQLPTLGLCIPELLFSPQSTRRLCDLACVCDASLTKELVQALPRDPGQGSQPWDPAVKAACPPLLPRSPGESVLSGVARSSCLQTQRRSSRESRAVTAKRTGI